MFYFGCFKFQFKIILYYIKYVAPAETSRHKENYVNRAFIGRGIHIQIMFLSHKGIVQLKMKILFFSILENSDSTANGYF